MRIEKDNIPVQELHALSNGVFSVQEASDVLKSATQVWSICEKGSLKGFCWCIDDEEECFVPHVFIEKGPHEQIYANALCNCLNNYKQEKNFLYTQIFNYPESVLKALLRQGYERLTSGMRYNPNGTNKKYIKKVLADLTVSTKPQEIDTQGVNDIYDAVGWGARDDDMWEKVLKNSTFLVQVSQKDKVLGFARVSDNGQYGMIYDVCVSPKRQKTGVGSVLMNEVVAYIERKNLKFTGLVVVPENLSAKSFYNKFNFESTAPILEFYRFHEEHQKQNHLSNAENPAQQDFCAGVLKCQMMSKNNSI